MSNVTTSGMPSNFRVEDVTYKHARRQSEILAELGTTEEPEELNVVAPKSLTYEQMVSYYTQCIASTTDKDKKAIYIKTLIILEEHKMFKGELIRYKAKEVVAKSMEETPSDL